MVKKTIMATGMRFVLSAKLVIFVKVLGCPLRNLH